MRHTVIILTLLNRTTNDNTIKCDYVGINSHETLRQFLNQLMTRPQKISRKIMTVHKGGLSS